MLRSKWLLMAAVALQLAGPSYLHQGRGMFVSAEGTETEEEKQEREAAENKKADEEDEDEDFADVDENGASKDEGGKPEEADLDDEDFDNMDAEEKAKKRAEMEAARPKLTDTQMRERSQTCLFVGRQHVRMDDENTKKTVEALEERTRQMREKAKQENPDTPEDKLPQITTAEKALDILLITAFTKCYRTVDQTLVEQFVGGGLSGKGGPSGEGALDAEQQTKLQEALMDRRLTDPDPSESPEESQLNEKEWQVVQSVLSEEREGFQQSKEAQKAARKAEYERKKKERKIAREARRKKRQAEKGIGYLGWSFSSNMTYLLVVCGTMFSAMILGLKYLQNMSTATKPGAQQMNAERRGTHSERKAEKKAARNARELAKKQF